MALSVAEVEKELLALDEHDRAAVIHSGLTSLEGQNEAADDDELHAAWRDELRHRIKDIDEGRVTLLDVETSHAALREELRARYT